MADESDGIEEALTGQIRVLVTAAGLVAETIARARAQQRRRAQAVSEQEARALESRLAAERAVARSELAVASRPEWWNHATPEQIGHAYQVARAWSHEDPEAERAEQWISEQLRSRYGVNTADTFANSAVDPAAVRAAVERAVRDRADHDQANRDQARAGEERSAAAQDHAEAAMLLTQADQQDRREQISEAATNEPDPTDRAEATESAAIRAAAELRYDSAARRHATARGLEADGVSHEAVTAKMYADVSQAKPPTDISTGTKPTRSPSARRTRGRSIQAQRSGVER